MGFSKKLHKAGRYISDPDYRFLVNASRMGYFPHMPDDEYLKRRFRAKMGTELNLDDPKTFNEKLQWLKIHDRCPI